MHARDACARAQQLSDATAAAAGFQGELAVARSERALVAEQHRAREREWASQVGSERARKRVSEGEKASERAGGRVHANENRCLFLSGSAHNALFRPCALRRSLPVLAAPSVPSPPLQLETYRAAERFEARAAEEARAQLDAERAGRARAEAELAQAQALVRQCQAALETQNVAAQSLADEFRALQAQAHAGHNSKDAELERRAAQIVALQRECAALGEEKQALARALAAERETAARERAQHEMAVVAAGHARAEELERKQNEW